MRFVMDECVLKKYIVRLHLNVKNTVIHNTDAKCCGIFLSDIYLKADLSVLSTLDIILDTVLLLHPNLFHSYIIL